MDRKKVMDILEEAIKADKKYGGFESIRIDMEILKEIHSMLKEQDAVEPKIGHWIWLQYCANEGVYCSECHTKMFDRYPMKKKLSQFCGHCGAKMDDEVDGTVKWE